MSLDQPAQFVKHQTVTRDAFLGGRITLSQPRDGFRAGLDSILLGAAVPQGTTQLLDLGAGVGTAAYAALALDRSRAATLVERLPDILALARQNATDNGFADRTDFVEADVEGAGRDRRSAGLRENAYDCVIANPPFFAAGRGTPAADAYRADARHMPREALALWTRTAAGAARAGGRVIFIYPASGLDALLSAFADRFGAITILPLSPRDGAPGSRVLVRGTKGSRAPLTLMASRALHERDGRAFASQFDAIFRGVAALDW